MKALIRFTALIIVAFAFVSSNAQDFEGVWYPSSDEGIVGNIKIKKEGDEYVVQYKTTVGLKTSKVKSSTALYTLTFYLRKIMANFG